PDGRDHQQLHAGHAPQGRMRRGLHERIPDEGRAAEALIVLEGVGMVYPGALEALRDIDLTVDAGELVALVGPSGCGKSTLLRIVAGLRASSAGRVLIDGRAVTKPVAEIGMVFQAPVLLKWRTVLDKVLLPAELSGLESGRFRTRAQELLHLVGLGDFAGAHPRQLSGGM